MNKLLTFIYGIVAYLVGMAALTFFILFIGGWDFIPHHIDSGTAGPLGMAFIINIGLIAVFSVHHTVTARPSFKRAMEPVIPKAIERSTYVLISGVLLAAICLYWQALSGTLWDVNNGLVRTSLIILQIFGWTMVVAASFLINHFELFGLQRVYCNLVSKDEQNPHFTDRLLYKVVRHPLQLGIIIGMWSTPTMSMTHLMLASTMTIYIFIGLYYEEKDLVTFLGKDYEDYQKRVHKLLPIPK